MRYVHILGKDVDQVRANLGLVNEIPVTQKPYQKKASERKLLYHRNHYFVWSGIPVHAGNLLHGNRYKKRKS